MHFPRWGVIATRVTGIPRAVVAPVDEKATGLHRRQAGERGRDPVALLHHPEGRGLRRLLAGDGGDKRADFVLVRLEAEIGLDPCLANAGQGVVRLESGRSRLRRLKTLDDQVGDGARPPFVGDEDQAMGGDVGRQIFEHGELRRPQSTARTTLLIRARALGRAPRTGAPLFTRVPQGRRLLPTAWSRRTNRAGYRPIEKRRALSRAWRTRSTSHEDPNVAQISPRRETRGVRNPQSWRAWGLGRR